MLVEAKTVNALRINHVGSYVATCERMNFVKRFDCLLNALDFSRESHEVKYVFGRTGKLLWVKGNQDENKNI